MPTFDGDNLVITLDSGKSSVDVQEDLYEPWKLWMLASPENRKYPPAFRSDGGAPLSSIINQGSYFFLNNAAGWRIRPPEEDITIYTVGNLAVEDTTLPAFIPTVGNFTAAILGLQPVTQGVTESMDEEIQYASFNGGVTVDTSSAYSGTGRTEDGKLVGTPRAPVNNINDAYTIAVDRGFNTLYVVGDLTLSAAVPDMSGFLFVGSGMDRTMLTLDPDANVTDCTYLDSHVGGTLDGSSRLKGCLIDNLVYVKGFIEQCVLAPGTIVLAGSEEAHFLDCWSGEPGVGTPVIDLGGAGQALALRNYNGGIKLINKSGPESVSVDLNSGQIKLGADVTAGDVVLRGVGTLTEDLSSGANIVDQLVNPASIGTGVMAASVEGALDTQETLRILLAAMAGLLNGAQTSTLRFRDLADAKDRIVAVVDGNGNRTAITLDGT